MDKLFPVLELQYVDETGTKGAVTVKYPIDTTVAVLDAQAISLASFIAPLTGCVLVRQRFIYKAVASPRLSPITGSDVKRQGVFIFEGIDEDKKALVAVPGILDSLLVTDGPGSGTLIDTSLTDVETVVDECIAGIWCNPFGDDIVTLIAAYRQSRA